MENSHMEVSCIWGAAKTQKPTESLDQKYWKKIFISSCLCAVLLDPLFLYVPILKDDIKCLMLDPKLKIVTLLLRSLTNFFYLMDIIIRIYRSENYSSLIDELNHRQHQLNFNFVLKSCVPRIAKTIWASYDILIDIVALLPLPHVAILIFFSEMSDLRSLTTTRMVLMNVFALVQYVLRVLRIYLSFKELKKRPLNDEIRETPIWIKGLLNFSMYIIASHVAGALCSFGSNLEPSADGWENLYTVFISISGLLLFLYLIGNLQMYMQFETTRRQNHKSKMLLKQKMEAKDRDIELWLFKRGVPTRLNKDMKLRIREKVQQALEDGMNINLDNILPLLPSDVQSRIEDYMPLTKLKQVPMLRGMDEGLLKRIWQEFEPVRYTESENSFIIQKGEQLDKMVYIVDGFVSIEERSSDDSRRGAGELCGAELLRWPFCLDFPHKKPLATESVKAIGFVEALALNASIYMQPDILEKEKPRHGRMMKEEIERNIGGLIRQNGIPERLNQDLKSRIMKTVEENFQDDDLYWDLLDWKYLVYRLTRDLQDEIKSYMPATLILNKMPAFKFMDNKVLKEICSHLQPMKYNLPAAAKSPFVITDVVEALVLTHSDMESVATEFRKHFIKNYNQFIGIFNIDSFKDRLGQILDGEINTDKFSFEMAKKVSELAMTCLRSRGEERPSMEKVAEELEGLVQTIRNRVEHSTVDDNVSTASRTSE
ncbi:hypothetical protein D8674_001078 [Pyrus ussuriensis x Pyrus communis]|uniref:Cyclic nucleotide-binding domain-containing protein n=1 Tax=Pyrus ussuriensis x Pyrus communis TaxID=2448454 RepID=A0A5N5F514_9ROSA|nr:hypothetical protein D8674_001078 [Pyrus ussuriensis x Pyrus communis]